MALLQIILLLLIRLENVKDVPRSAPEEVDDGPCTICNVMTSDILPSYEYSAQVIKILSSPCLA